MGVYSAKFVWGRGHLRTLKNQLSADYHTHGLVSPMQLLVLTEETLLQLKTLENPNLNSAEKYVEGTVAVSRYLLSIVVVRQYWSAMETVPFL